MGRVDHVMVRLLAEGDYGSLFFWMFVIIAFLVAAFVGVTLVRRALFKGEEAMPGGGGGFTLGDLRELNRTGQLSDEEFEKAKAAMVEATKRAAERRKADAEARGKFE